LNLSLIASAEIFNKEECQYLVNLYKKNIHLCGKWQGTYPLSLVYLKNEDNILVKNIAEKLCNIASEIYQNKLTVEVVEIVRWPKYSRKDCHKDTNRDTTVLASITYLNSNYAGGRTIFENNLKIEPIIGKTIFFDGRNIEHSVEEVFDGERYTLAIWYKIVS